MQTIWIAGAVPALVMVQDEIGDGVDAEAVEHAKADLRVAFEHEPLRIGQRAGLAQDLLRNGELAEVVEAARETCELDLLRIEAQPRRDARDELADALGVTPRVRIAGVDGLCERRGRPVTRGLVRPGGKPLELRELDDLRAVEPHTVLAVLLRPVQSAVGQADELVAAVALHRKGREPRAHRHGADVLEVDGRDPLHDRIRGSERRALVVIGEQKRELVAAEPEGLAVLAKPRADL